MGAGQQSGTLMTASMKLVKLKKVKFIYSEKSTKFCEIFTLLLSYAVPVKSKEKISKNFVAFSEYMNLKDFNLIVTQLSQMVGQQSLMYQKLDRIACTATQLACLKHKIGLFSDVVFQGQGLILLADRPTQ